MLEELLKGLLAMVLIGALMPVIEFVGSALSEVLLEVLEAADAA